MDERNDSGKTRVVGTVLYARRNVVLYGIIVPVFCNSEVLVTRNILSDNTCDKRTSYDTERTLFIDESRGGTE